MGPFHIQHHTTKVTVSYSRQPACSFWFLTGALGTGKWSQRPMLLCRYASMSGGGLHLFPFQKKEDVPGVPGRVVWVFLPNQTSQPASQPTGAGEKLLEALYGAFVIRLRVKTGVNILEPTTFSFLIIGCMIPYWPGIGVFGY